MAVNDNWLLPSNGKTGQSWEALHWGQNESATMSDLLLFTHTFLKRWAAGICDSCQFEPLRMSWVVHRLALAQQPPGLPPPITVGACRTVPARSYGFCIQRPTIV